MEEPSGSQRLLSLKSWSVTILWMFLLLIGCLCLHRVNKQQAPEYFSNSRFAWHTCHYSCLVADNAFPPHTCLKKPDMLTSGSSRRTDTDTFIPPPSSKFLSYQLDNYRWDLFGFPVLCSCCCILVLPWSQAAWGQPTFT